MAAAQKNGTHKMPQAPCSVGIRRGTDCRGLVLAGISDFNSIFAQNHTSATLSRQPPIALAAVGWQVRLVSQFRCKRPVPAPHSPGSRCYSYPTSPGEATRRLPLRPPAPGLSLAKPLMFSSRIACQPCGIVQIFIPSQSAAGGLPEQLRQGRLCIAPTVGIHQVILKECCQAKAFIKFTDEQQNANRSHPRSLKIGAQEPVEGELKGLILALTLWVSTSGGLPCAGFTHEHRRCMSSALLRPAFKSEIREYILGFEKMAHQDGATGASSARSFSIFACSR